MAPRLTPVGAIHNDRIVEDGTDCHCYREYEIADSFFEVSDGWGRQKADFIRLP
jgi:hypothetical protein